jgi:hypothetical protein
MSSPVGSQALRIVLLGRPGAGKSSLLGALAIAGDVPTHDSKTPHLIDAPGVLTELRQQVEHRHTQPTIAPEQVVPYLVAFEESAANGARSHLAEALLVDCDNTAILELLNEERPPSSTSPLTRMLAQADALVLAVPAPEATSASEDFAALERLLRIAEQERGTKVLPGGLPVLLAVTQCDLLAETNDTPAKWQERVRYQVEAIERRFQKFRDERDGLPAFGQVTLLPAAVTAAYRPALAGAAEEPARPFGVAELFGECVHQALRYRHSQGESTRRLLQAALGLVALVAALVAFALYPVSMRSQADWEAIRDAVDAEVQRNQSLQKRGTALSNFADYLPEEGGKVPWPSWYQQADKLFAEEKQGSVDPQAKLPGADRAIYQTVLADDKVKKAQEDWQYIADKLRQRQELVSALGMVEPRPERPALLQIPPDFTTEQAAGRLTELAKAYPDYKNWSIDDLPWRIRRELAAAAETSGKNLIVAGQKEILNQLQRLSTDGKETPELWRKLRDWLASPKELRPWHELTLVVTRFYDAEDPLERLKTFLDQGQYGIELQRLVLRIPSGQKITPAGKLAVFHGVGKDEARTTLWFKQLGDARRDDGDQSTRYTFVPEAGETLTYRLNYKPGDTLWAELPVKVDGQDRLFTWSVCRSQVFQFERLVRPPRLHRKDQLPTEGELAEDVALIVAVGIVPRLPDLMPVVKLTPKEKNE